MQDSRIAVTAYLNNRALFRHPLPGGHELLAMYPRQAITAIAAGYVQAAVVPVAGLAKLGDQVEYLGEYGISADGQVGSVLFFSDVPFQRVGTQHVIQLTSQSATSINLLALLFSYRLGNQGLPTVIPGRAMGNLVNGQLLIGDDALARRADHPLPCVTDLAEQWAAIHHLPFVFARWVVRRDAPAVLKHQLLDWLAGYCERETEYQMQVAEQEAGQYDMSRGEVFRYLQGMRTRLGPSELTGQQLFLSDLRTLRPQFPTAMEDLRLAYA